jgi:hypothetical protein
VPLEFHGRLGVLRETDQSASKTIPINPYSMTTVSPGKTSVAIDLVIDDHFVKHPEDWSDGAVIPEVL